MAEFFMKKMAALKQDLLEEQWKERKLNEQVQKVQQQLGTLRAKNDQPTGNIIVRVNAGSRAMAGFEFSYVIASNVTWYAFYDLKAKDVNSPFELVYKAKVNQSSGEDWEQVKISLSTGNPSIGNQRPVMSPWYLNYYMPYPTRADAYKNEDEAPQYHNVLFLDIECEIGGALTTEYIKSAPMKITSIAKFVFALDSLNFFFIQISLITIVVFVS
jgi:uncharacterized protein (TIGR02231 family)